MGAEGFILANPSNARCLKGLTHSALWMAGLEEQIILLCTWSVGLLTNTNTNTNTNQSAEQHRTVTPAAIVKEHPETHVCSRGRCLILSQY